jgi:hypothetical protein
MKQIITFLTLFVILFALLVITVSLAVAQSGGGYDLTWSTIDGGGGTTSDGGYTLDGTIGQPDAEAMSGGGYSLVGGFWGGALTQYRAYLPLMLKGS